MAAGSSNGETKNGRPRALRGVLRQGEGPLPRLGERSRHLARVQRHLQRALPGEAAGQWQLARVDAEEVQLVARSPAWATRLRYQQSAVLAAAAELIGTIPRHCRITVEPPRLQGRRPPPRQLSRDNARLLEATADGCDDPRLAQALRRLASRAGD
ncbi:DciA family protein [Arhodomonas sp. SL1]|uniref:DciA family protein n=1 Tax=Arhodomonas sp. SL1 TaxID=3425691 RepID=UPI003F881017